jgi:hypothetical protein
MANHICSLMSDYLALASHVTDELKASLGVERLLTSVNNGVVPRRGRFPSFEGGEYFFHGIGCRVIAEQLEIDFDYGPDETLIGADPWKLYNFADARRDAYPWLPVRDDFRKSLESMIAQGELHYCAAEPGTHLVCLGPQPIPES